MVRTQNFLIPAALGSGTCGRGALVSGTNAEFSKFSARVRGTRGSGKNVKFSKSSRAW